MSTDDIISTFIIVLAIFFGPVVSRLSNGRSRALVCFVIGFVSATALCREEVIHSFVLVLCNAFIVCFSSKRWCHVISFVWCFGYLGFFTVVAVRSNNIQLFMVLKMVGIAFEAHDGWLLKKKLAKKNGHTVDDSASMSKSAGNGHSVQDGNSENVSGNRKSSEVSRHDELYLQHHYTEPSFLDMFLYGYCYIGLFAGPYFKYSVYQDFIRGFPNKTPPPFINFLPRLLQGCLYVSLLAILTPYYPMEYLKTEEFFTSSFFYRLWFLALYFTTIRVRFYGAFAGAECACMSAGFGAYPEVMKARSGQGPTDLPAYYDSEAATNPEAPVNYETVINLKEWDVEMCTTMREPVRSWNISVQWWLYNNVHRRFPLKPLRSTLTMVVSAFWHGTHPGYYISFLHFPLCLLAEQKMNKCVRARISAGRQKYYDYVSWFVKLRVFEYMSLGFLMLNVQATLRVWASLYYYIPILFVVALVSATIIGKPKKTEGIKVD